MHTLAPIALFVYDRPHHTINTLKALQKNNFASETDLIIFSDGPKNELAVNSVSQVRDIVLNTKGFKSVDVIQSPTNKGLSSSIIEGVSKVLNDFNRIIVMEDDLETSPYFIQFMNEALEMYENEDDVVSIHGYRYPTDIELPQSFFLKGADCWGWATWKNSWKVFEEDGRVLLKELKTRNLVREFDFDKKAGYTQMLIDQIKGKNDSWAVRWYASAFLRNKLTLYPGKSFVQNIGHDNSGTHKSEEQVFKIELNQDFKKLEKIPIEESKIARMAFESFFQKIQRKKNLLQRVKNKISNFLV